MSGYAADYFVLNRWILRCIGIWPPDNRSKIVGPVYRIYAITAFLYVTVLYIASEIVCLFGTYKDEVAFTKNLSMVVTHFAGAVKTTFFCLRRDKVIGMIRILESGELRYDNCEEKSFFPGQISKTCKADIIKLTALCFIMPHLVVTSSFAPAVLQTLSYVINTNSTVQLPDRLPYYSWIPFKMDTFGHFILALLFQAGGMFGLGYTISGTDSIFMSLMHCISQNLVIIQGAFLTIRERSAKRIKGPALAADSLNNSECLNDAMNSDMRKVSRNLQTIFNLCWELEREYKYLTLLQVLSTLLILCTCLYSVSSAAPTSKQFYTEIVFLAAMSLQPFMYCWFGNEVTLKADEMSNFIYRCDWLGADAKFKRSVIFNMTRLMKPIYLTAGNFVPLTLATFLAVMKGSYSFFTVLKGTNE